MPIIAMWSTVGIVLLILAELIYWRKDGQFPTLYLLFGPFVWIIMIMLYIVRFMAPRMLTQADEVVYSPLRSRVREWLK